MHRRTATTAAPDEGPAQPRRAAWRGGMMVVMATENPEWVVLMEYENLPGCPHAGVAVWA